MRAFKKFHRSLSLFSCTKNFSPYHYKTPSCSYYLSKHKLSGNAKKQFDEYLEMSKDKTKAENVPTAYTEFFNEGKVSVRGALNLALYEEFARDPNVVLLGEEVAQYNGAYKISKGLWKKYGDNRVVDTPITEMGFTGVGVGSALNGLRPIVEFMSFNFSLQAIDQIINSAAKLHYMSGGTINVPITLRGCNGAAKAVAAQHSQDLSSWYGSVPGLKVYNIYDIHDARECLKSAIRDPDPCVVLENEIMYGEKFEVTEDFFDENNIKLAQFGKGRLMKQGKDLTIASHSRMLKFVEEAALILEKEDGVSVEIINNRCIRPFDRDLLINSVKKTHHLVYVEEGWPTFGVGAEVCAIMMESEAFDYLDAPVERVCSIDVPMPYCPSLETMVLPSTNGILAASRRCLGLTKKKK